MIRRVIQIDREKCNGCGACAEACHEGAIGMVDGKAELLRDDYCDGLGDCLPACPTGAITFTEREAAAYDEKAVLAHKQEKMKKKEQAGGGHAMMIDGMLDGIAREMKLASVPGILTGGLAGVVLPCCTHSMLHKPELTLTGLLEIYRKNRK